MAPFNMNNNKQTEREKKMCSSTLELAIKYNVTVLLIKRSMCSLSTNMKRKKNISSEWVSERKSEKTIANTENSLSVCTRCKRDLHKNHIGRYIETSKIALCMIVSGSTRFQLNRPHCRQKIYIHNIHSFNRTVRIKSTVSNDGIYYSMLPYFSSLCCNVSISFRCNEKKNTHKPHSPHTHTHTVEVAGKENVRKCLSINMSVHGFVAKETLTEVSKQTERKKK